MNIGNVILGAGHSAAYVDANGNERKVWGGNGDESIRLEPRVLESGGGIAVLSLGVRNIGRETVRVGEAAALDVSARRGGSFAPGGGGNSWTMLSSPSGPGVKDLCNPCHDARKLDYGSADFALIGSRKGGRYALLGFLEPGGPGGRIVLKLNESGFSFERLAAVCDFSGAPLAPGESLNTGPLYVNTADAPKAALAGYVKRLAAGARPPLEFRDIVGWATWDYYQSAITEQDILENMQWLDARAGTLPVRYIQLDAGFARREGDWLDANDKFPHGLKWIAGEISSHGYIPGIWMCPFLAAPDSEVCKAHPDWVIRSAGGEPLELRGYAVPRVYGLDCSIPAVLDWLRDLARRVTVEFGFGYVKVDGANGQVLSGLGRLRNPAMTPGAAARAGLAAFRSGMAPGAFLLNSCAPLSSVGLCDGMRIGEDVGGRWDASKIAKHHGERDRFNGPGEVLRSIAAAMNHFHFHKKAWVNDPDYLVVRQEGCNSELTYEEARTWASVVGLGNGLVMLGDCMPRLRTERVELLEKILPHYRRAAEPVDFFRKDIPSFYALESGHATESWKVVCVLNPDYPARSRDYALPLSEIGLSAEKEYCLFDFWNCRYLGTVRGTLRAEALAPHDCRVFRLAEASDQPMLVGSDIHISMGGIEVERSELCGGCLKIRLSSAGRRGNLFIRGPAGWAPLGAPLGAWPVADRVFRIPVTLDGSELTLGPGCA